MASFDGYVVEPIGEHANAVYVMSSPGKTFNISVLNSEQPQTIYIMRAVDDNYIGAGKQYRIWSVVNEPDFDVEHYAGAFSGAEVNFIDIVVLSIEQV